MRYHVKYETYRGEVKTEYVHGYDERDAIRCLLYRVIYWIKKAPK